MGKHGGTPPIPPYWGMIGERVGRRFAREEQICAGMCSLADRLPASRAELKDFAVLSFECALRRRCGKQKMGEHVPSAKPTGGVACRTDRFCCSIIRVQKSAWHMEITRAGGHNMCEHALTDRLTISAACKTDRLHNPVIRV